MPVPTYDQFIEPVLRYLAAHPEGALARDVHEAAAETLALSAADRQEILPSGAQAVYQNRSGWAHDRLKRAGYSSTPRRGLQKLTPEGLSLAIAHPGPLPPEIVEEIATSHKDVRLRAAKGGPGEPPTPAPLAADSPVASPDDRLGLEKVYVQAKRWQSPVGRPEVQGFYGALAGQRAGKGVFITTSTFTPQAVEFARSVEGIVPVDGRRLAELMMDHEVGVTLRPVKVPKLDGDYFE